MKKNDFVVGMTAMVLSFGMAVVACSSAPFVYDATVPPEESSTLIINECQVYKFNGTTMSAGKWSAGVGEKTVIIPAGTHTLEVWGSESSGSKLTYGKVEITHTFLPGRTYRLRAPIEGNTIKAVITYTSNLTSALVPNPESPDATPLEGTWINTSDEKQQWIFADNEFSVKQNGAEINRGMFTYKGNTVTLNVQYVYAFKKWIARNNPDYKLTYDGSNTFKIGETILKKVE